MPNSRGSVGGRAGEAGSLHRAGVAAFLAACGLRGKTVGGVGIEGKRGVPRRIALETGDATDDLRCDMSDGSVWFVQAKRTCGDDQHFRDTLTQWAAQPVGPTDVLVLAAGSLKGTLSHLEPALRRLQDGEDAGMTAPEKAAIKALNKRMTELKLTLAEQSKIKSHARLMKVSAGTDSDVQTMLGTLLLDGTLVELGKGEAAFRSLRGYMQGESARAGSTSLDEWISAVEQSGIDVFSDARGPAGARRKAVLAAVSRYRKRFEAIAQQVRPAGLPKDIPPLALVPDASNLIVEWTPEGEDRPQQQKLVDVARRHNRLMIRGLPGMGKSIALEQIAGIWAGSDEAPLPVLVRLRDLARTTETASEVTIANTLTCAIYLDGPDRELVLEGVENALHEGRLTLFLDGLDEGLDESARVLDGLALLIDKIPEQCGFVLSGRPSAEVAARRLALPMVDLITPSNFGEFLDDLLAHIAAERYDDEAATTWLKEKRERLKASQGQKSDIWSVPLLATLAVVAISDSDSAMPLGRLTLLRHVLAKNVDRFEFMPDLAPEGGWDTAMRPEMLIDVFAEIGHALSQSAKLTTADATLAAMNRIGGDWGCPSALSRRLATQAIWFWDERASIFLNDSGGMSARSRQFSELGDALWISVQVTAVKKDWVFKAVNSEHFDDVVLLAALEDGEIVEALLAEAGTGRLSDRRVRALDCLLQLHQESTSIGLRVEPELVRLLADAARDKVSAHTMAGDDKSSKQSSSALRVRRKGEPDGYYWAKRLAGLRVSPSLRATRQSLVEGLSFTPDHDRVLSGLLVVTDKPAHEQRALIPEEIGLLGEAIEVVLPPRSDDGIVHRSRRYLVINSGVQPVDGLDDIAVEVALRVVEFPEGCAQRLFEISERIGHGYARRIKEALADAGFEDPNAREWKMPSLHTYRDYFDDHDGWGWLFRALASEWPENELTQTERWHLQELNDAVIGLNLITMYADDICGILGLDDADVRDWLRIVLPLLGLDPGLAGGAARALLEDSVLEERVSGIVEMPALVERNFRSELPLTEHDIDALVALVGSDASVVHECSRWILARSQDARTTAKLEKQVFNSYGSRETSGFLRPLCSSDPEATIDRILAESDVASKHGAARFAKVARSAVGSEWVTAHFDSHPDGTLRYLAGAGQVALEAANYWTCTTCEASNETDDLDCSSCPRGTRIGKH